MQKNTQIFFLIMVILTSFVGCKKKKEMKEILNANCSGVPASYNSDLKPLVNASCMGSGCHGTGSSNGDFTTYAGIKNKSDNGSLFSRVVKNGTMPPAGALTKDQRIAFKCWIDNGAQNN